jgi:ribonuclease D
MDTHYLPALRDRLIAELTRLGRLEEAREIFTELPDLPPASPSFDPEGYWRIGDTRHLKRSQMGIVRELYLLRDEIARRRDWPSFKIFGDKALVRIAQLAPRRIDDLYDVKGLNSRLVQRDGGRILDAVARGRRSEPPEPPRRSSHIPSAEIQQRYEALHDWRKTRAAERGVESDVIVSRDTLWALARRDPSSEEELAAIPGLGPWRRAEYGAELIEVLAKANRI